MNYPDARHVVAYVYVTKGGTMTDSITAHIYRRLQTAATIARIDDRWTRYIIFSWLQRAALRLCHVTGGNV